MLTCAWSFGMRAGVWNECGIFLIHVIFFLPLTIISIVIVDDDDGWSVSMGEGAYEMLPF